MKGLTKRLIREKNKIAEAPYKAFGVSYDKVRYAVYENNDKMVCLMSGQSSTKTEAIWALHDWIKKNDITVSDRQVIFTFDVQ